MGTRPNKEEPAEKDGLGSLGRKKYGRLVRMFRDGCISVCIYENAYEKRVFYDTVVFRKIKIKNGSYTYKRGANLKFIDLDSLIFLLKLAKEHLISLGEK